MPELPEVKTICNDLSKILLNKTIVSFNLLTKKSLRNYNFEDFTNLKNQKVISIQQMGKNIIWELTDYFFVLHLRMEGNFNYVTNLNLINLSHIISYFKLDNNKYLIFNDYRKFATIDVYSKSQSPNFTSIKKILSKKIGPEPWEINEERFYNQISKKNISIKQLLLDQKYISGLGNIYVNEVLFMAKINPKKKANNLNFDEIKLIIKYSKEVLEEAIKYYGTTVKSFTSFGTKGKYQSHLKVHSRENKLCKICNNLIKKEKIGGRGTYYCPSCQK